MFVCTHCNQVTRPLLECSMGRRIRTVSCSPRISSPEWVSFLSFPVFVWCTYHSEDERFLFPSVTVKTSLSAQLKLLSLSGRVQLPPSQLFCRLSYCLYVGLENKVQSITFGLLVPIFGNIYYAYPCEAHVLGTIRHYRPWTKTLDSSLIQQFLRAFGLFLFSFLFSSVLQSMAPFNWNCFCKGYTHSHFLPYLMGRFCM